MAPTRICLLRAHIYMLAFDLETHPISPGDKCPPYVCCSFANEEGARFSYVPPAFDQPIVGCNIAYDMAVCYEHLGVDVFALYEKELIHDIAIREMLLDVAKGLRVEKSYSLESLVERRFPGTKIDKDPEIRLTFHKNITPRHIKYAEDDAMWTFQVYMAQEAEAESNIAFRQALTFEHFECEAAFALHLMSVYGMVADPEWVRVLLADTQVKYEKLKQQWREIGVLREDDTKDKKVLQELVYKAYKGNPPRTDKGAIKTDRLTLEESDDPLLEGLTGDGPIEKIITTYGKVLEEACDHPYNARYNVIVSSGRTSGNFQQWPRGGQKAPPEVSRLRASFIPRAGRLFCAVDLQAAELVSLAEVCFQVVGWSRLRDAINSGQDLHTALAARLAGISYEEAIALVKAGDKKLTDLRQSCKPINFGLPGMMGALRLVGAAQKEGTYFCELAGLNTSCCGSKCKQCLDLAYGYVRAWKDQWPEVPVYHAWIQRQNLDPFVTPITGWVRGGLYPSEAANHPFQHLTSRAAKLALIRVTRACYDPTSILFGCKPVMFAHDEIMAEVDNGAQADEMARLVEEASQSVTQHVNSRAEAVLMERWWKGAKPVRNERGELIVWRPKSK